MLIWEVNYKMTCSFLFKKTVHFKIQQLFSVKLHQTSCSIYNNFSPHRLREFTVSQKHFYFTITIIFSKEQQYRGFCNTVIMMWTWIQNIIIRFFRILFTIILSFFYTRRLYFLLTFLYFLSST